MNMKVRNIWSIIFSILLFSSIVSAAHLSYFTGNLDANQEVPPNSSTANGFGRITLDSNTNMINVSVYYSGLSSGVTVGHIHGPAAPGSNGGVLFDLAPTAGQMEGSVLNKQFPATVQNIRDLRAGLLYFNIHTSNNTGGEIRGQIRVDSPYVATLDGNQENPNVNTPATGSGVVSLNSDGSQGLATVNWTGLSANATVGHIHQAQSGINGSVVCNLNPPTVMAGGVSDILCNFTAAQSTALKKGLMYFNIHSSNNTGGEIRGQIHRQNSSFIDLDGDTKTDISIFRPDFGEWWYLRSSDNLAGALQFGQSTDKIVPADYTGDGIDDIAFWRESNGFWFVLRSEDNSFFAFPFGASGDIPVPGDYDGDGITDSAIFRPSTATWFINNSASGSITIKQFGGSSDKPVAKDYDGDGKVDMAVYRRNAGGSSFWFIQNSGNGNVKVVIFGISGDLPIPSDYTGDGKADVALYRRGQWFIVRSDDESFFGFGFGAFEDLPVPGDYDGDGKTDAAVVRPSNNTWFLQQSTNGSQAVQFGVTKDTPLPGAYIPNQ